MANLSNLERPLILVTGPTRSGKSEWAEHLAADLTKHYDGQDQRQVVYVATAATEATDPEWQSRILRHQQRRPAQWQLREAGADLVACLQQAQPSDCLLIDALGTWLVHFLEQADGEWGQQQDALLARLQQRHCPVILVAEETGWGVVPAYASGRRFRDRLGSLTRRVGAMADIVYLVAGGHALNLTQLGTPLPPIL